MEYHKILLPTSFFDQIKMQVASISFLHQNSTFEFSVLYKLISEGVVTIIYLISARMKE